MDWFLFWMVLHTAGAQEMRNPMKMSRGLQPCALAGDADTLKAVYIG